MLYACILADLLFAPKIPRNATLNIGSEFEGGRKLFFLLHTVRTPVSAIHHNVLLSQAVRKRVIAVTSFVQQESNYGEEQRQHSNALGEFKCPLLRDRLLLLLSFSSFL